MSGILFGCVNATFRTTWEFGFGFKHYNIYCVGKKCIIRAPKHCSESQLPIFKTILPTNSFPLWSITLLHGSSYLRCSADQISGNNVSSDAMKVYLQILAMLTNVDIKCIVTCGRVHPDVYGSLICSQVEKCIIHLGMSSQTCDVTIEYILNVKNVSRPDHILVKKCGPFIKPIVGVPKIN